MQMQIKKKQTNVFLNIWAEFTLFIFFYFFCLISKRKKKLTIVVEMFEIVVVLHEN